MLLRAKGKSSSRKDKGAVLFYRLSARPLRESAIWVTAWRQEGSEFSGYLGEKCSRQKEEQQSLNVCRDFAVEDLGKVKEAQVAGVGYVMGRTGLRGGRRTGFVELFLSIRWEGSGGFWAEE